MDLWEATRSARPSQRPTVKLFRSFLERLAILWVVVSLVYLALDATTGARVPPVVALGHFRPFLLLGALPLLSLALWRRQWPLSVGLALIAAAGLYLHRVEVFFWAPELRADVPAHLVLETWNVGNGRASAQEVRQALEQSPAHVVLLQEWEPRTRSDVQRLLVERFPHQHYFGAGKSSMALLSRFPVADVRWVEPEGANPWLSAKIATDVGELHLVGVHLDLIAALLGDLAQSDEVLIGILGHLAGSQHAVVAGDFNLTGWSRALDRLKEAGFTDAFLAVGEGFGFTFPTFGRYRGVLVPPVVRIDHIWCSPSVAPLTASLAPLAASDHLALRAELRLQ